MESSILEHIKKELPSFDITRVGTDTSQSDEFQGLDPFEEGISSLEKQIRLARKLND